MESNINIRKSSNEQNQSMQNTQDNPRDDKKSLPKSSPSLKLAAPKNWGMQETIIVSLILLIFILAGFAAAIFFNLFPTSSSNSASSSSTLSKTSVQTSSQSSSQTSKSSSSSSMTTNSTSSSKSSTSTTTSSTSTSKTSSNNSSNSSSSSKTSSSSSSLSSTTSAAVNGNTKLYLVKSDKLEAVGRNFTGTGDTEKVIFAILERVKGPSSDEISSGYKKDINISGESNCNGSWFEISSPTSTTLQIKFCRTIQISGTTENLVEESLTKTVTDNSNYTKVIVLNREGTCLFNSNGENKCLK